jgi:hypothetical protein
MLAGIPDVPDTMLAGPMKCAAPATPVARSGCPAEAQKHQTLPILRPALPNA